MTEFRWTLLDAGGNDLRSTAPFSSREEAEQWMGGHWSALIDEGAESAALVGNGEVVYHMGLREE